MVKTRQRWTRKEEVALLQGAGVYGFDWFERHTGDSYDWPNAPKGRSRKAIKSKAGRLFGGGITRGVYTLTQLCKETGYSISQIRRAMSAVHQKWKRTSKDGSYLIHDEQVEELIEWLRHDYWCTKHRLYRCLWCDTENRSHRAQGLCFRCYNCYSSRLQRAGLLVDTEWLLKFLRERKGLLTEGLVLKASGPLARGRAFPKDVLVQMLRVLRGLGSWKV